MMKVPTTASPNCHNAQLPPNQNVAVVNKTTSNGNVTSMRSNTEKPKRNAAKEFLRFEYIKRIFLMRSTEALRKPNTNAQRRCAKTAHLALGCLLVFRNFSGSG